MPVRITPIKGYTTENLADLKLLEKRGQSHFLLEIALLRSQ